MSKRIKVTLWTISIATLLLFISSCIVYWKVSTEWRRYFTDEEMERVADEISESKELTPIFYGIWDKLHNSDRHKSIVSVHVRKILNDVLFGKHLNETSWHSGVGYYFIKNGLSDIGFGFGLENFVTSEKCFDYMIARDYETVMKIVGFYNLQEPSTMTDTTEILKFITIINAPSRYRNEELLNQKVKELKEELNCW